MTEAHPPPKRRYRGMDAHEREALRREKLIEAGLETFGTAGYTATTVDDVCRRAGLAKRYFYESFADREALMLAVYDVQIRRLQEAVFAAALAAGPTIEEQVEVSIAAFVRAATEDERVGRTIFLEVLMTGLQARWQEVKHEFADFFIDILTRSLDVPRTPRIEMGTMILVGALVELITDWIMGNQKASRDDIAAISIEHFHLIYDRFLSELEPPVRRSAPSGEGQPDHLPPVPGDLA